MFFKFVQVTYVCVWGGRGGCMHMCVCACMRACSVVLPFSDLIGMYFIFQANCVCDSLASSYVFVFACLTKYLSERVSDVIVLAVTSQFFSFLLF